MKFLYSSNVHSDHDTVWGFIMDFKQRPDWIHFFEQSFVTHQTANWIGSKYKEKFVFLGIPLFIEYEIYDYKEKSHFKSRSKMPPFYPELHVTCKDNGDGTIYSSLEFDIKLGPVALLPKKLIQSQVDNLIKPCIENYVRILDKK